MGKFKKASDIKVGVVGYGASFVAQGTPADMAGLAKIIEEGIRYPGFAFINVQSPCVTYGDAETQMKMQRSKMRKLEAEGHDATNRIRAMELAADYGKTLYTGVFYRNPNPPPTYGDEVATLQQEMKPKALPMEQLLSGWWQG